MQQLKERNPLYLEPKSKTSLKEQSDAQSASGDKYTNPFCFFSSCAAPIGKKGLYGKFCVTCYRIGARWYDPEIGIWTTPDPAGQYHNPYSYGGGDPVNGVDPDGELFISGPAFVLYITLTAPRMMPVVDKAATGIQRARPIFTAAQANAPQIIKAGGDFADAYLPASTPNPTRFGFLGTVASNLRNLNNFLNDISPNTRVGNLIPKKKAKPNPNKVTKKPKKEFKLDDQQTQNDNDEILLNENWDNTTNNNQDNTFVNTSNNADNIQISQSPSGQIAPVLSFTSTNSSATSPGSSGNSISSGSGNVSGVVPGAGGFGQSGWSSAQVESILNSGLTEALIGTLSLE